MYIPPEEPASVYRKRIAALWDACVAAPTIEEANAFRAAMNSARLWRKRRPIVIKMLTTTWKQFIEQVRNCIEYFPEDLILDFPQLHCHRWRDDIIVHTSKDKYLDWDLAGTIPKNIYDTNIAMRRLFSVSVSVYSLTQFIREDILKIQSTVRSGGNNITTQAKAIEEEVGFSLLTDVRSARPKWKRLYEISDSTDIDIRRMATITQLLHLVSLTFEEYSTADLKHHPYHFHTEKLNGIRMRLIDTFSTILELCRAKLNVKNLNNNPEEIIKAGEHCLQTLIPLMMDEYYNIQSLITIVEKDRFYSKSQAMQVIQSFPKGSSARASVKKKLCEDQYVSSQMALRRQLEWCETLLDCCQMGRPIVDHRWCSQGGRKRKADVVDGWLLKSLWMDLYPIEMRLVITAEKESMHPIITLKLFSRPERIDVCSYLRTDEYIRLYFCPKQFHVPIDPDRVWEGAYFQRLKWFIEYSSMKEDCPVKYAGKESKAANCARFRCKHYKEGRQCPFFFVVKVDQYGYYIEVYNYELDKFVGWKAHDHRSRSEIDQESI